MSFSEYVTPCCHLSAQDNAEMAIVTAFLPKRVREDKPQVWGQGESLPSASLLGKRLL